MKFVNAAATPRAVHFELRGVTNFSDAATRLVLTGDPMAVDGFENPVLCVPQVSEVAVGKVFTCEEPAYSLSVLRIRTQ